MGIFCKKCNQYIPIGTSTTDFCADCREHIRNRKLGEAAGITKRCPQCGVVWAYPFSGDVCNNCADKNKEAEAVGKEIKTFTCSVCGDKCYSFFSNMSMCANCKYNKAEEAADRVKLDSIGTVISKRCSKCNDKWTYPYSGEDLCSNCLNEYKAEKTEMARGELIKLAKEWAQAKYLTDELLQQYRNAKDTENAAREALKKAYTEDAFKETPIIIPTGGSEGVSINSAYSDEVLLKIVLIVK